MKKLSRSLYKGMYTCVVITGKTNFELGDIMWTLDEGELRTIPTGRESTRCVENRAPRCVLGIYSRRFRDRATSPGSDRTWTERSWAGSPASGRDPVRRVRLRTASWKLLSFVSVRISCNSLHYTYLKSTLQTFGSRMVIITPVQLSYESPTRFNGLLRRLLRINIKRPY